MEENKDNSISRTMRILETVSAMKRPATLSEINKDLNIPKASLHRICNKLKADGYIQDLFSKGYVPGKKLIGFAFAVIQNESFLENIRLILGNVSEKIGETCNVTVPNVDSVFYLERVETRWPLKLEFPQGSAVPLHCTASGKLFLSSLPSVKKAALVQKLKLDQYTSNTLTDKKKLLEELKKTSRTGIGTDNEEFIDGMVAIAVALRDDRGRYLGSLSTHAPKIRVSFEKVFSYVDDLKEAAAEISTIVSDA